MTSNSIAFPERPECAEHRARIVALEHSLEEERSLRKDVGDKLDNLKTWVMTTLAAALTSVLLQFLHR